MQNSDSTGLRPGPSRAQPRATTRLGLAAGLLWLVAALPQAAIAATEQDFCGRTASRTCAAPDRDGDGYGSDGSDLGRDCDDADWQVYRGISAACDAGAGPRSGWRTCQVSGAFTACALNAGAPLCEAKGEGRCWYSFLI